MVCVKSWVEIDAERLAGNFAALNRVLGDANGPGESRLEPATLLAVVKANAYGHGIAVCAPLLAQAGAQWLGVTDAQEGVAVREALSAAGIVCEAQPEILVMSGMLGLPDEAEAIVREGLTAVVWEGAHLELLAAAARRLGVTAQVPVHLEIDTGMARQGVACGAALKRMLGKIKETPELRLDGVFTHFASTEVAHAAQTCAQKRRFEGAMVQVAASGLRPKWVHVGNSSFLDNGAEPGALSWLGGQAAQAGARPMARSGLALYGYLFPIEGAGEELALIHSKLRSKVRPVMAWKTQVIGLREVEAGRRSATTGSLSRNGRCVWRCCRWATRRGLRRELSGSNGKAGRVGDATRAEGTDCGAGVDEFDGGGCQRDRRSRGGRRGHVARDGVTAEDHARLAGTIAYDIICGVRVRE